MWDTLLQILREQWGWTLLRGAAMTLCIAFLGMALGVLIGIVGAQLKNRGPVLARWAISLYTTVVRSTPELLIIYLLFFGSLDAASALSGWFGAGAGSSGIAWHAAAVGVVAIGLISGSYSVEVFRGALNAIPLGHIEAAHAIGMSPFTCLRRVILPQMVWYALPGSNNVWQTAIKDTALISLVGLVEIMRAAQLGAANTREPLILYGLGALLFFMIALISQAAFSMAERHFGRGLRVAV